MLKCFNMIPDRSFFCLFLPLDVHVTCQYSADCLLPCSFTPSGSEEIQWFRQDFLIFRLPQNTNQNDQLVTGRTSMSAHELPLGNASLLLQHCVLSDRGRYRCQVMKGEKVDDHFVLLKVEGELRFHVLKR